MAGEEERESVSDPRLIKHGSWRKGSGLRGVLVNHRPTLFNCLARNVRKISCMPDASQKKRDGFLERDTDGASASTNINSILDRLLYMKTIDDHHGLTQCWIHRAWRQPGDGGGTPT